jgi:hypothetical protein
MPGVGTAAGVFGTAVGGEVGMAVAGSGATVGGWGVGSWSVGAGVGAEQDDHKKTKVTPKISERSLDIFLLIHSGGE